MFNMKQYMYLGVMGALSFVLAFVLGNAVNAATGIPLTGGIVNGIIVGIMLTLGVKGVDKFGAATTLWLIFAILAIPTTTLGATRTSENLGRSTCWHCLGPNYHCFQKKKYWLCHWWGCWISSNYDWCICNGRLIGFTR
ncbi:MAG: hypothetical protein KAX39_00940 [candidate division Zixibacteria bacterium]|nr:hypothetical protein [candidate division Zixibacteria bacterium]